MPTRLLRDGILDSDALNSVSEGAELLYRRLMSLADDHGRYDGRVELLRVRAFPLPPRLNEWPVERVEAALEELAGTSNSAGEPLVLRYDVANKPLLQISRFGQRIRAESKYPAPEPADDCAQMPAGDRSSRADDSTARTSADKCGQMPADVRPTRARGRSEAETETETEAEAEAGERAGARPSTAALVGYGEFGWARMTEDERRKLDKTFGLDATEDYVGRFDRWVEAAPEKKSNGVRRRDRQAYLTIRNWYARDNKAEVDHAGSARKGVQHAGIDEFSRTTAAGGG